MTRFDTPHQAATGCAGIRPTGCAGLPAGIRLPALALLLLFATALPTASSDHATPVELFIQPPELTFDNNRDGRKLIVTGVLIARALIARSVR